MIFFCIFVFKRFLSAVFFSSFFITTTVSLANSIVREKILSQTKHVEDIFIFRLIVSYDKEITNVICYSLWSLLFVFSSYLFACLSHFWIRFKNANLVWYTTLKRSGIWNLAENVGNCFESKSNGFQWRRKIHFSISIISIIWIS